MKAPTKMTVKELMEAHKDYVVDMEAYHTIGNRISYHTDSLYQIEPSPDDLVIDYTIMDEDDYNNTVLANCGERADFADWYGDKDSKVLVILAQSPDE